jgi:hypothetical protein
MTLVARGLALSAHEWYLRCASVIVWLLSCQAWLIYDIYQNFVKIVRYLPKWNYMLFCTVFAKIILLLLRIKDNHVKQVGPTCKVIVI